MLGRLSIVGVILACLAAYKYRKTVVCPDEWIAIGDKCFSPPNGAQLVGQPGFPPGADSYCQSLSLGSQIMTRSEAEQFVANPSGINNACDAFGLECGQPLGRVFGYTRTTSDTRIWYTNFGWDAPNPAGDHWFTCVKAGTNPSAVGDPHLTNLRGERFDIHDGMHRLVHYPQGVSEDEALLVVDVQAVDMGHEADCYSVYLQNISIFGRWVGEGIAIRTDTSSSVAESSLSALRISFAGEQMDWPVVAKHHDVRLNVHGSMPVTVNAHMRKAAGEDAMGGEEITFNIGDQRPVLVQVWSSHGANQLTHGKEVRYLNLEVQNLPKDSGGILGLDSYSRPSSSQCDLIQEERNLMHYIEAESATLGLLRLSRPKWQASATAQQ